MQVSRGPASSLVGQGIKAITNPNHPQPRDFTAGASGITAQAASLLLHPAPPDRETVYML
jgi:hypothetical protein